MMHEFKKDNPGNCLFVGALPIRGVNGLPPGGGGVDGLALIPNPQIDVAGMLFSQRGQFSKDCVE